MPCKTVVSLYINFTAILIPPTDFHLLPQRKSVLICPILLLIHASLIYMKFNWHRNFQCSPQVIYSFNNLCKFHPVRSYYLVLIFNCLTHLLHSVQFKNVVLFSMWYVPFSFFSGTNAGLDKCLMTSRPQVLHGYRHIVCHLCKRFGDPLLIVAP